jgi:hypothetical protein
METLVLIDQKSVVGFDRESNGEIFSRVVDGYGTARLTE